MGHRVLPSGSGRGETVVLLRDHTFFLNDKLLDDTSLWLVHVSGWHAFPVGTRFRSVLIFDPYSFMVGCYVLYEEDITKNLFIPFSQGDSPRVRFHYSTKTTLIVKKSKKNIKII